MSSKGTLYVIAAPSGGGKTSLTLELLKHFEKLKISISYTTRPPRPGEKDGVSYNFVDEARFKQMIADKSFLEYAEVFGHYYGTSKEWILSRLDKGVDVLLDIDWQGARQLHHIFGSSVVTIFILPPSRDALLKRLEGRNQDQEKVIEQRMAEAVSEMSHYNEFDYIIINDKFDDALDDLKVIVRSRRLERSYQQQKLAPLLAHLLENR